MAGALEALAAKFRAEKAVMKQHHNAEVTAANKRVDLLQEGLDNIAVR